MGYYCIRRLRTIDTQSGRDGLSLGLEGQILHLYVPQMARVLDCQTRKVGQDGNTTNMLVIPLT